MATETIQLRCLDSFADVRADAGGALDGESQPSPFDRLDWFEALHGRAFADRRPLVLRARRGDARAWLFLAGAPGRPLTGIANWYSFAFRPQFAGAPDRATRRALLGAIAGRLRGLSAQISLHPVVDEAGVDAALIAQAFRAAGWLVIPWDVACKRLIELPPGTRFADYWAARPGTLRSTLRRKAQRHPLEISIHAQVDDALWTALERVFRASWKPDGDDFAFLRAFAESEARGGRLRLGLARTADGRPVAVELWTIERGRAYIHKLAFDERAADASPGTQLSHAMFRRAIDEDGVATIDFGTGDNGYKASWMPHTVPMRTLHAFDLRRPACWPAALGAWLSALSQPAEREARRAGKAGDGRRAALARRGR